MSKITEAMVEAAKAAYLECHKDSNDCYVDTWISAMLSAALSQVPVGSAWEAHDETCDKDNFATSIYETGYDGLLVARCNQNGNYPWQAAAIIRGLTANKSIPSALSPPAVPGEVHAQLALIKHLAEYTTEKNWDDKRLYIMQAVDRALSVPLPEIEGGDKGDGWQTIETAPKDAAGCFEDACIIGFVTWGKEGRVHKHVGPAIWQEITGQWEFTEISFDIFPAPTHWHPLPAAPSASSKEESGE